MRGEVRIGALLQAAAGRAQTRKTGTDEKNRDVARLAPRSNSSPARPVCLAPGWRSDRRGRRLRRRPPADRAGIGQPGPDRTVVFGPPRPDNCGSRPARFPGCTSLDLRGRIPPRRTARTSGPRPTTSRFGGPGPTLVTLESAAHNRDMGASDPGNRRFRGTSRSCESEEENGPPMTTVGPGLRRLPHDRHPAIRRSQGPARLVGSDPPNRAPKDIPAPHSRAKVIRSTVRPARSLRVRFRGIAPRCRRDSRRGVMPPRKSVGLERRTDGWCTAGWRDAPATRRRMRGQDVGRIGPRRPAPGADRDRSTSGRPA